MVRTTRAIARVTLGQVAGQGLGEIALQGSTEDVQDGELLVAERLPDPAPEDRAELVLRVEGQAVVDAVTVAFVSNQHYSAIPDGRGWKEIAANVAFAAMTAPVRNEQRLGFRG